jgi:hypothetical protein
MNADAPHLDLETITDIAVGDRNRDAELAHVRSCPRCEMEVSKTTKLLGLIQSDTSEDAPAFALAAILRSFDDYHTAPRVVESPSVRERLRAILRLDSAGMGPAFGFRSSGTASSRQLLFSADNVTLDIRITQVEGNWVVSGQVLGQMTGGTVTLAGDQLDLATDIDSAGNFALDPVPAGTYKLCLVSQTFDIEVPDLVVG